jgi:hypothetical protein
MMWQTDWEEHDIQADGPVILENEGLKTFRPLL